MKGIVTLPIQVVDVGRHLIHGDTDVVAAGSLLPAHAPHPSEDGRGTAKGIEMTGRHPRWLGYRTKHARRSRLVA